MRRHLFVTLAIALAIEGALVAVPLVVLPKMRAAYGTRVKLIPAHVALPVTYIDGAPIVQTRAAAPLQLLLDTGAGSSVTNRSFANERGIRATMFESGPMVNGRPTDLVWVRPTMLGDSLVPRHLEAIVDMPWLQRNGVAGILGCDVLWGRSLLLDLPHDRVELGAPCPSGFAPIAAIERGRQLGATFDVEGRKLELVLDTGCGSGLMLNRRLQLGEPGSPGQLETLDYDRRTMKVSIAGWSGRLQALVPTVAVDVRTGDRQWDGLIGAEWFRQVPVWIDFDKGVVAIGPHA